MSSLKVSQCSRAVDLVRPGGTLLVLYITLRRTPLLKAKYRTAAQQSNFKRS